MKRFYSLITSMSFMAFLLLAVAFSMAIATFVESNYGTPAARSIIYNRFWFELLWMLLAVNLINNLFKYKLFTKRRFTMGLFHVSFLIILLGAAITRYFGFEGMMHIRESQSANFISSSSDYFYAGFDGQECEGKVEFSDFTPKQYSASFNANGKIFDIKSVGFISDAERKAIPVEDGEAVIDFVFATSNQQGMQSFIFKSGDILDYPEFSIGFENRNATDVKLFMKDDQLFINSDEPIGETTMSTKEVETFKPGDTILAKNMFLYVFRDVRFLIRNFYPSATFTAVKSNTETGEDAVIVEISDGESQQTATVFGHSNLIPDTVKVPIGNKTLKLAYGAKPISLPFEIYLKDFQLERYPGSESPSSFASEVKLIDKGKGVERDMRIFMNNTLKYGGYKFFQSSYDSDEKGTVLSVNHDIWGTRVTYIGYLILAIGMILSLFNLNSYFLFLANKLKKTSQKAALIFLCITGATFICNSQNTVEVTIPDIDQYLAIKFSEIWVQGADGRIEPVSTLASEIVRKVSRKSGLYNMTPSQVVLSMMAYPDLWRSFPIVRISEETIAQQLGVSGRNASIRQLFDVSGNYKIAENVKAAYGKAPAFRNRFDKEYINLDEKVNICFMVFQGSLLRIFPRSDRNEPWYTPGVVANEYTGGDSIFVKSGFNLLIQSVVEDNIEQAGQVLNAIESFQIKNGGELLPSNKKKNIEILYNDSNPFKRIFPFYLLFGLLLLAVLFINIFRQKPLPGIIRITFFSLITLLFFIHTVGLAVRWYIAGHAPWSNGYESVVYVAWAVMLAGLIFGRKYSMVVGTAAFLSGIALFVAHLSWMSPELTNLVPVLKSYWLVIHVAIITSSYGFFGLSAFLGILGLILMIIRSKTNSDKVEGFIEQLTTINEMSATVGLYFLTIGTFLGGVWANESWGRYWGWDPKETWALITVMIYSFIVHMRLIPSLKGAFNYTVASIFGFASVLMTYFGVNYFLSGLHSYGKGVANGIHPAVPISFAILFGLMVWAYFKDIKFDKDNSIPVEIK